MLRVTIEETPDGWRVGDIVFPTATEAIASVRRAAADRVARTRVTDVVEVEWKPTTRTGRIIARAVAASQ